jgi:hypothetical protein
LSSLTLRACASHAAALSHAFCVSSAIAPTICRRPRRHKCGSLPLGSMQLPARPEPAAAIVI